MRYSRASFLLIGANSRGARRRRAFFLGLVTGDRLRSFGGIFGRDAFAFLTRFRADDTPAAAGYSILWGMSFSFLLWLAGEPVEIRRNVMSRTLRWECWDMGPRATCGNWSFYLSSFRPPGPVGFGARSPPPPGPRVFFRGKKKSRQRHSYARPSSFSLSRRNSSLGGARRQGIVGGWGFAK